MYRAILFGAILTAASTAHAQVPDRASSAGISDEIASISVVNRGDTVSMSAFEAELRWDLATSASGEATFGKIETMDPSSAVFVISLGVCGQQSAILFTRRNGTPLSVGSYRVSEAANGTDEIMALVLTGQPTHPSGVFRGQSGWLTVTSASDRLLIGRFQVDAIGWLVTEPHKENRSMTVTGSFSASAGSSSLRVCRGRE
jgi:hypothetical protein